MKTTQFLIKPASSTCSLRCRYCFYEDISNNRTEKNFGIMSRDTVRILLQETFFGVQPGDQVVFAFQGGEPTMAGLDFFRDFVEQVQALRPAGVGTAFAIQTNAVLLNQEWAAFFAQNRFLVGISLDGYKELHNLYRRDGEDRGTWNKIIRNLQLSSAVE